MFYFIGIFLYHCLKPPCYFSNAVAKPFTIISQEVLFAYAEAFFPSPGRTGGLFPRLKTPKRGRRVFRSSDLYVFSVKKALSCPQKSDDDCHGGNERLKNGETVIDLSVRPAAVFPHVIVDGSSDVPEKFDVKKTLHRNFDKPQTSVDKHDNGRGDINERTARFQRGKSDDHAHRARARVAHHKRRRFCVEPEISEKNGDEHERRIIEPVDAVADDVNRDERQKSYRSQRRGKSVNAVGAVRDIDRRPDEDNGQYSENNGVDTEREIRNDERHGMIVVKQERNGDGDREQQIEQTFFILVPRNGGRVVEKARQHRCDDNEYVNAVFDAKIAEHERGKRKDEDKDYTRAARFARGKFSVNGKFPAPVARKPVFQEFCERERRNERKKDADTVYERTVNAVYQIEHIQPPKFSFTVYYTIHLRIWQEYRQIFRRFGDPDFLFRKISGFHSAGFCDFIPKDFQFSFRKIYRCLS